MATARQLGAIRLFLVVCLLISGFPTLLRSHPLDKLRGGRGETNPFASEEAKEKLSQVFGIDPPPIPHHNHRSPPQYMIDLYNAIADTNGITKGMKPFNADVIRSFPDRDTRHQTHYYFNVSFIKPGEEILEAEFHLFKMKPRLTNQDRPRQAVHLIELKVYQVLDVNHMFAEEGVRLLDARRLSGHTHGWEVFNVKKAVEDWAKNSSTNHGFLVTAKSLDGAHLNGTYVRFAQRSEHHDSKQPILVVFTDEGKRKYFNHIAGAKNNFLQGSRQNEYTFYHRRPDGRFQKNYAAIQYLNERFHSFGADNTSSTDSEDTQRQGDPETSSGRSKRAAQNYYGFRRRRKQTDSCDRHELYVDFEAIGWSGWIISPKGYNAYHCKGECPFPLGQNQKPTNHATVQSIVHALKVAKDVGAPCCVPNKLYSISLLYFDDHENVILKQYDDMVAASCGCH
ncbi:bone morphogenetic protein 7 [Lingula anatina]|uniref:Bone morphogenetic protein 7 n=1 Tax=Lingula anatina TaxID=7574 RepID=A0A1S3I551_LINAN|nr:bone morphogenetic protein 7 [Lingula anatina]XP_013393348.1 bone morphogenetic protein 7 [Lingula anatina]XP_013393349.1 bone morphogenetic protein 7 [Lingula anatina]|eukprot:XP_013393347.1 bone morphogenetic protein 7 [Lingula anatina]